MGKHHRKRRRKAGRPQKIQKFAGVYFAPHPFNTLDKAKLRDALSKIGEDAVKKFEALVEELQHILDSVDALQAIACLATYGLTATLGKNGDIGTTYKGDEFTQAHVELALAFALRTPLEKRGTTIADADTIQKLFELLSQISKTFSDKRLVQLSDLKTDEERSIVMLQDHLRLHTQAVRNWGYFDEVVDTIQHLTAPLDGPWEGAFGLSGSWIVRFFRDRVKSMEDRFTARLAFFREIDAAPTLDDFLARLFVLFPAPEEHKRSFADFVNSQAPLTRMQRRAAAFHYSDAFLHIDFLLSAKEVADQYGVRVELVDACFRQLSLAFGELKDVANDFVLLGNPVWSRPLVSLDHGIYYCALPQGFFSFAFQILNELTAKDSRLQEAWARRRAEFLEGEIETVFRDAFPTAVIATNYKWKDTDAQYENDVLIQVGSHLIIIEAKSGVVSWPALRGAPERAKKHFRELIIEPSIQSLRLKEKIDGLASDPEKARKALPGFPFNLATIKRVLRLSVTLEDFGLLQTNIAMAIDAGWVPKEHQLPPTMILGDLRAAFQILDTRAEKIHYLQRRQAIQTTIDYVGDEMDLLGLYLANGFDVGGIEGAQVHLAITGMSSPIDEFFQARAHGNVRTRPRRKLTKWWRDICIQFEKRDFDGWTEASTMLLDVGYDDQRKLESKFRHVQKNVMRRWQEPGHLSSVMLIPPKARGQAIVAYAYRDAAANERQNAMESMAGQVFEGHQHVNRCLVVGMNLDKKHYPYSSLAIFHR